MNRYEEFRKYSGRGGVMVWLEPVIKHGKRRYAGWSYRFAEDTQIIFHAKSKFDALLAAAWKNGRSCEKMDWRPVQ